MTCALYAQVLVFSSFFPMSPPLALPNATPAAPLQLLGLNPSRAALGRLRRRHSDWAGSQATTCHRLAAEVGFNGPCVYALCPMRPCTCSLFFLSPVVTAASTAKRNSGCPTPAPRSSGHPPPRRVPCGAPPMPCTSHQSCPSTCRPQLCTKMKSRLLCSSLLVLSCLPET